MPDYFVFRDGNSDVPAQLVTADDSGQAVDLVLQRLTGGGRLVVVPAEEAEVYDVEAVAVPIEHTTTMPKPGPGGLRSLISTRSTLSS